MNDRTEDLQPILDRLAKGDPKAKEELITRACERMRRLARKMLRCEPRIARWEQTDDVLNTALLKLNRALDETKPATVDGFFDLATQHMRWELINLARHHYGPHGDGRHHLSDDELPDASKGKRIRKGEMDEGEGPSTLAEWANFHEKIKELPPDEQAVFNLLYYHEMSQEETARRVGVDKRTVQRRWRSAKLNLAKLLRGEIPKT